MKRRFWIGGVLLLMIFTGMTGCGGPKEPPPEPPEEPPKPPPEKEPPLGPLGAEAAMIVERSWEKLEFS